MCFNTVWLCVLSNLLKVFYTYLLCMYVCACVIALVQQSESFHHVSKDFTHGAIPLALSNPLSITYVPCPPILGIVSSLNKRNIDSLHKKKIRLKPPKLPASMMLLPAGRRPACCQEHFSYML